MSRRQPSSVDCTSTRRRLTCLRWICSLIGAKLSDYSKSYVAEAVKQGYINGYTNGTFKPQGTLSRGEIAKMLYGYMGTSAE